MSTTADQTELSVIDTNALTLRRSNELIERSNLNETVTVLGRASYQNSRITLAFPETVTVARITDIIYLGDDELDKNWLISEVVYPDYQIGPRVYPLTKLTHGAPIPPGQYRVFMKITHKNGRSEDFAFDAVVKPPFVYGYGTVFKVIATSDFVIQVAPGALYYTFRRPYVLENAPGAVLNRGDVAIQYADTHEADAAFIFLGVNPFPDPLVPVIDAETLRVSNDEYIACLMKNGEIFIFNALTQVCMCKNRQAESFDYGSAWLERIGQDGIKIHRFNEQRTFTISRRSATHCELKKVSHTSSCESLSFSINGAMFQFDALEAAYTRNGQQYGIQELSQAGVEYLYVPTRLLPPKADPDRVDLGVVSRFEHALITVSEADTEHYRFRALPGVRDTRFSYFRLGIVDKKKHFRFAADGRRIFKDLNAVGQWPILKGPVIVDNKKDIVTSADLSELPNGQLLAIGDNSGWLHVALFSNLDDAIKICSIKVGGPSGCIVFDENWGQETQTSEVVLCTVTVLDRVITATIDQKISFHRVVEKDDGISLVEVHSKYMSTELQDLVFYKDDQVIGVEGSGTIRIWTLDGRCIFTNGSYAKPNFLGTPFCLGLDTTIDANVLFIGLYNGRVLVSDLKQGIGDPKPIRIGEKDRISEEMIYRIEVIDKARILCVTETGEMILVNWQKGTTVSKGRINTAYCQTKALKNKSGELDLICPHPENKGVSVLFQPWYSIKKALFDQVIP
jgi:hypothetical protein